MGLVTVATFDLMTDAHIALGRLRPEDAARARVVLDTDYSAEMDD